MGQELVADVVVVGGGLGGVAAALAVARRGARVVLTEETDWIGGQLTAQAVPPDEHPWIEQFGCTASYRTLRDGIRGHYRRWFPLTAASRADRHLNPGGGRVSRLCHEPRVAVAVLEAMLAPHRGGGRMRLLTRHVPVAVDGDGDRVTAVTVRSLDSDEQCVLVAPYVIDATETGQVLPLAGVEHVTGFESQAETGEPHAPARAQPRTMQAVTHCFAVDHHAGQDHVIARPEGYDRWRRHQPPSWPGPMLGWTAPDPKTGRPRRHTFRPNPDDDPTAVHVDMREEGGADDLWTFRRIAARRTFVPGAYSSDITLVNWPMADYTDGPVVSDDPTEAAGHAAGARELAASLLYWLQTEAPRPDGGGGWPGLRPRPDVTGTADGFAKSPYIRESRRIRAQQTVVEQDLSLEIRGERGAVRHPDSVGVGAYRIDLHPSTGGDGYLDIGACPFQIPLGALLPVRVRNLLPAAKNIGTTHITNGCYRLHPVEWNIGEAAGMLAAYCLSHGTEPAQVRAQADALDAFRSDLVRAGVELAWPEVRGY